ncbi:MAG: prephenate dehydrogenase dimerization domain-containing protein [Brevinema sp.]
MLELSFTKIVIHGWNNITASIAEGIRSYCPNCKIYCPDASEAEFYQAHNEGYLDALPDKTSSIYEDADYIIIDKNGKDIFFILKSIESFLVSNTCIIDFQHIKGEYYEKTRDLIPDYMCYVSAYIFLDDYPLGVRKSIFKDKIVAVICDNRQELLNSMKNFWGIFDAKIIPTSSEFYDEIFATTMQTPNMMATIFSHILQKDSWADTLFFGFYNKQLRNFVSPVANEPREIAQNMINNRENIIRMLSFMKREIDTIQDMIDNENTEGITSYIKVAKQFKNRI